MYDLCCTKTMKTVAPKENISHIPADVLKVKKARIPITIAADIPDAIGSKFFVIFIYFFLQLSYIHFKGLKKWFLFF